MSYQWDIYGYSSFCGEYFMMKSVAVKVLTAFCVVLIVFLVMVYRENTSYQNKNTRLIILNDSILSENIELKKKIDAADSLKIKDSIKLKKSSP